MHFNKDFQKKSFIKKNVSKMLIFKKHEQKFVIFAYNLSSKWIPQNMKHYIYN
jgi:hypothetical protein